MNFNFQNVINPSRVQNTKKNLQLSKGEIRAYLLAAHPDKNNELNDAEKNCFSKHLILFKENKKNEITINDSQFCINFIKETLQPYWKQKKEEKKEFDVLHQEKLKLKYSHIKELKKIDICKATIKEVTDAIYLIQELNKSILELHKKYNIEPSENFNLTATDILSEHTKINSGCEYDKDEL